MKTVVANYKTRIYCIRIVPKVGAIIRLTSHPKTVMMQNGNLYLSTSGYEFTGYSAGSTSAPAMIDIQGVCEVAGIGIDKINSGVFDNARCYIFATNWDNPVEDYEEIVATVLGKTHIQDKRYLIEQMSLSDVLNQNVGKTFIQTCQKKFGGQEFAGCKINLTPYTFNGSVTTSTNQNNFVDTSLTQAQDYFTEGLIQFTSGLNANLKPLEIKKFQFGGFIETYDAFYYNPQIGDTFTIIAGCRKRIQDCVTHNNVVNFGGFPNVPTQNQYTKIGIPP